MNLFTSIRKNIDHILLAFSLLIAPGLLFAVAGVESVLTPCHVSTLNALPLVLFFMAFVAVGLGVLIIIEEWER